MMATFPSAGGVSSNDCHHSVLRSFCDRGLWYQFQTFRTEIRFLGPPAAATLINHLLVAFLCQIHCSFYLQKGISQEHRRLLGK